MATEIYSGSLRVNPELICAFCWFIFVIIENARFKKQNTKRKLAIYRSLI